MSRAQPCSCCGAGLLESGRVRQDEQPTVTDEMVERAAKAMWDADDSYIEQWGEYEDANNWYRRMVGVALQAALTRSDE